MTLGQTLYNLRTKANMTQEQLAEKMHVSRQSISKWESDAARPDLEKLKILADLYQISMDKLLGKEAPADAAETSAAAPVKDAAFLHLRRLTIGLCASPLILTVALAGITVYLSGRISSLQKQIAETPVPAVTYYPYTDTDDTDDSDSYFQSFSEKVLSVDNNTAQVQFTAILKAYTDTTSLSLQLQNQDDAENTPVAVTMTPENNIFTGTASLPVNAASYRITAFIDTDGQKQTVDVSVDTPLSLLTLTDWQPCLEQTNNTWSDETCDGDLSLSATAPDQISHISSVILELKNKDQVLYSHPVDQDELDIIRQNGQPYIGYSFTVPRDNEVPDLTLCLSWYNDILQKYITCTTSVTDNFLMNITEGSYTYFGQEDAYDNPVITTFSSTKPE